MGVKAVLGKAISIHWPPSLPYFQTRQFHPFLGSIMTPIISAWQTATLNETLYVHTFMIMIDDVPWSLCVSVYLPICLLMQWMFISWPLHIYTYIYIVIILQFQCAPFHQSVVRGGSTPKNYLSKFLQAYIWAVHKASNVIHLVHSKQDLCCQRPILNSFLTKGHVEQRPKKLGTYKHLLNLNLSCLAVSK